VTSARGQRRFRQRLPDAASSTVVATEAPFAVLGIDPAVIGSWMTVERAFVPLDDAPDAEAPAAAGPVPRNPDDIGAAVLLPLYRTDAGEAELILIRRAVHLRSNPGEIAFPGGRLEPGESPLEAALRESEEEVGLPRELVSLLGPLPFVQRASRREPIASFVGAVTGRPKLTANPTEVDEILVASLAELADPGRYWEEMWSIDEGTTWRMHFFERDDDVIWGASARMLTALLDRLASSTAATGPASIGGSAPK
jgi:8-oxo-dGTP pyrophosphatase MutT (NUDIX family)